MNNEIKNKLLTSVIHCYILFIENRVVFDLNIILNYTSMVPIYIQLMDQIKKEIIDGKIKQNDILPSVRVLSAELKISALTVKKAYDKLEEDGFVTTVHGKGTFVSSANQQLLLEERKKGIEDSFNEAIQKARNLGISDGEILEIVRLLLE